VAHGAEPQTATIQPRRPLTPYDAADAELGIGASQAGVRIVGFHERDGHTRPRVAGGSLDDGPTGYSSAVADYGPSRISVAP